MSVRLELNGMAELREALRNLPEHLAGEASHIVGSVANGAGSEVRQHYKRGKTGNLIAGVEVAQISTGKAAAGYVVRSKSPHSHLVERGTVTRRTASGANRGAMKKSPENERMIPIVIRARRRMYGQLADLLRRMGFIVEGL